MKHMRFLIVIGLLAVLGAWSLATVEVQTTTPRVNPRGERELVGQMKFIYSQAEFYPVEYAYKKTTTTFVLRVQLTRNRRLVKVGTRTTGQPMNPIHLAWQKEGGWDLSGIFNYNKGNNGNALFVAGFYSGDAADGAGSYLDVYIRANQEGQPAPFELASPDWNLTYNNRAAFQLGVDQRYFNSSTGCVPDHLFTYQTIDPTSSTYEAEKNQLWQDDTRLCVDFTYCIEDLLCWGAAETWYVGLNCKYLIGDNPVAYDPNTYNTAPTHPTNFQPANPGLAQKGSIVDLCELTPDFPGKGEECATEKVLVQHDVAKAQFVSTVQGGTDPCTTKELGTVSFDWDNDIYCPVSTSHVAMASTPNHTFTVKMDCEAVTYGPSGILTLTVDPKSTAFVLKPLFTSIGGSAELVIYDEKSQEWVGITVSMAVDKKVNYVYFTIPKAGSAIYDGKTLDWKTACLWITLPDISYVPCKMADVECDDTKGLSVLMSYSSPTSCSSTGTVSFAVADIYGLKDSAPIPGVEHVYLWYPYLAPFNMTDIYTYVVVTNYANLPTNNMWMDLYKGLTGAQFTWNSQTVSSPKKVVIPANAQNIMDLNSTSFQDAVTPKQGQPDQDFPGTDSYSAILTVEVDKLTYAATNKIPNSGLRANIDSFVWIVVGDTAQGYLARTEINNYTTNLNAPGWNK